MLITTGQMDKSSIYSYVSMLVPNLYAQINHSEQSGLKLLSLLKLENYLSANQQLNFVRRADRQKTSVLFALGCKL